MMIIVSQIFFEQAHAAKDKPNGPNAVGISWLGSAFGMTSTASPIGGVAASTLLLLLDYILAPDAQKDETMSITLTREFRLLSVHSIQATSGNEKGVIENQNATLTPEEKQQIRLAVQAVREDAKSYVLGADMTPALEDTIASLQDVAVKIGLVSSADQILAAELIQEIAVR